MQQYNKDNIFAKIINGQIPCEMVYQDEYNMAFKDIAPAAPVHVLIVPKGEYVDFTHFTQNASAAEVLSFFQVVKKVAKISGVIESGYRIVSNCGQDANQLVPHFHLHLLGGSDLGGLIATDNLNR